MPPHCKIFLARTLLTAPKPAGSDLTAPKPVRSDLTAPKPVRSDLTAPKPVRSDLTAPKPVYSDLTAPKPVRSDLTAPHVLSLLPPVLQEQSTVDTTGLCGWLRIRWHHLSPHRRWGSPGPQGQIFREFKQVVCTSQTMYMYMYVHVHEHVRMYMYMYMYTYV